MFVDFESLNEKMQIFSVSIFIDIGGNVQHQSMQAPRMMIERQFISLVQQAAQSQEQIKITMSMKYPLYDEWHDKWLEGESNISFSNNACKNEDNVN